MVADCATRCEGSVALGCPYLPPMALSNLEFWALLAIALLGLFVPVIIVWWKDHPIMPIAVLSLAFWPGALILALRLRRRQDL